MRDSNPRPPRCKREARLGKSGKSGAGIDEPRRFACVLCHPV